MTADRDYIISRIRTKAMTAEMFDFEKLACPYSLTQLFTYDDIWKLYELANSVKYAGKPVIKNKEINNLMRMRGFEKLQAGTNRVCFRFLEDSSFVVKVAYDSGGLKDNPAEYYNQKFLNQFCTKVFECAPNGSIASFERVKAIKSREEYYTIYEDVFRLIKEFLIPSGYIMEDIGTWYFMNIGVRPGFGPVFLDFSFLYELDNQKLYCTKPDNNSYTGLCEGEIDYDPGYNYLYCKKCGIKYKAIEIAKRLEGETSKIFRRRRGGNKVMKITLNGGDKAYKNEQVEAGNQFANSIPKVTVKPTEGNHREAAKGSVGVVIKGGTTKSTETPKFNFEPTKKEQPKTEAAVEEAKAEEKEKVEVAAVEESKVEQAVVEEPKEEIVSRENAECPVEMVTFDGFKSKLCELVDWYKYLANADHDAAKDSVMTFIKNLTDEDADLEASIKEFFGLDEYYLDEDDEIEATNTTNTTETNTEVAEAAPATNHSAYDSDISRFEAVMVDIHDVVDTLEPENVLLIKEVGADGYLTVGDNQLFAIDMIDGNYISTLTVVAKDYLENLESEVSKFENLESKPAPTGV